MYSGSLRNKKIGIILIDNRCYKTAVSYFYRVMLKQNIKLSVDAVVFSHAKQQLHILLIQRKNEPFKGQWALPGGFVEDDEDLLPAAIRELEEETGMKLNNMEQLGAFGKPGRDPRGRTVTIAYYTTVDAKAHKIAGADDAADARWFDIKKLPAIAFDHNEIIDLALKRLNT